MFFPPSHSGCGGVASEERTISSQEGDVVGRGPATIKKSDVKAAVQAVIDVGCDVERVEVDKNGTIIVLTRNPILKDAQLIDQNGSDWDMVLPDAAR